MADLGFDGKVAIVTGAGGGLGREHSLLLARRGALVVVNDVGGALDGTGGDAGPGQVVVDEIKAAGGEAVLDTSSVATPEGGAAIVQTALDAFGRIDALVNNAALYGGLKGGRFDTISESDWDAAMSVNVKGIWNCCKAVVPAIRRAGGGSIVNIASLAATYGMPYGLHYTTSKAAVIGLTRGLARELGRDNIRVNAVAPSAVLTEGTREFFAEKTDKALDTIKMNQAIPRNLESSDLVGAVHWLVSDASRLVTGQTIAVDGGTVMH
jgi:3-oxoacyl-[acyl-carrier protein] reductase